MDVSFVLRVCAPLFIAFGVHAILQRFIRVPKRLASSRANTYFSVFKSALTVFIYGIAVYFMFLALHVNVTPLFASAGVVGIILGLGIRPFIEDFFTGLFILTEDTIRIGDYVEIGGSEGITESLGLRTVRIRDKNGAIHMFPNREIKKIVNYSKRQARVIVDVPVKSNQSVDTVIEVLDKALSELRKNKYLGEHILEHSRVEGVEAINPGSTIIRVLILTRATERWNAARTFRRIALRHLEKANILLA